MLNGTAMQHANMIVAERSHQAKQAKEQSQALELKQKGKERDYVAVKN
jgi:hypothetical protein